MFVPKKFSKTCKPHILAIATTCEYDIVFSGFKHVTTFGLSHFARKLTKCIFEIGFKIGEITLEFLRNFFP